MQNTQRIGRCFIRFARRARPVLGVLRVTPNRGKRIVRKSGLEMLNG